MAASQPQLHLAERRSPDRRNRYGFRALPGSHSPPPRITRPLGWRLPAADGGGPAHLGGHQRPPEQTTTRDRQLRKPPPDPLNRPRMIKRRSAAPPPARYPCD